MTGSSQGASCLPGEHPDLADLVQTLRVLGAAAVFTLDPPVPPDLAFVRFDDDAGLELVSRWLVRSSVVATDPETRARARALLVRFRSIRRALLLQPQRPSEDTIVWRYVCGEIDGSTACSIADWSEADLVRACASRGFPNSMASNLGDDGRGSGL